MDEQQFEYRTGRTEPQKKHNGLIAFLLILVIFLSGLVSVLGILNIHLFRLLETQDGTFYFGSDYRRHSGALTSTMRKDQFNTNLEKMLLKNRPGFGKLDMLQKYYFYRGLYICRKNLGDQKNPYEKQYRPLRLWYYWTHQVPHGLKRRMKILRK